MYFCYMMWLRVKKILIDLIYDFKGKKGGYKWIKFSFVKFKILLRTISINLERSVFLF